jgi:TPR repeat protein
MLNLVGMTDQAIEMVRVAATIGSDYAAWLEKDWQAQLLSVRPTLAACDRGELPQCVKVADWYRRGWELPIDPARARALYQRACDGGMHDACVTLAAIYRRGINVAAKPELSAHLLERSCEAREMVACNDLGDQYEHGLGITRDLKRALELYNEACDSGTAIGCISLASLAWAGMGVPRDLDRAVALLERATKLSARTAEMVVSMCSFDDKTDCALAGLVYERGIGVSPDAKRAREFMRRACEIGDHAACQIK